MATANFNRRGRISQTERIQRQQESLQRAAGGISMANYPTIIRDFAARGIPVEDIRPRENVFTFNAWKALGRYVKKGEKGVAVVSFVPTSRKERDASTGETKIVEGSRPVTAYVFHVSQTAAAAEGGAA